MSSVDNLKGYAIAIAALAAIDLVAIAVVTGFGTAGLFGGANVTTTWCAINASTKATADCQLLTIAGKFVTGLTIFATFTGVIILALIGKVIVGLYKGE